jgi:hypothetical protein
MARVPRLGPQIDKFFKLRKERLKLESAAKAIKTKEDHVKDRLIIAMDLQEVDSSAGVLGTVSITRPEVFRAADWPKIYAWVKKTGAFEIFGKTLHQSNIVEQLQENPKLAKKGIPGMEKATIVKFHATAKRGI